MEDKPVNRGLSVSPKTITQEGRPHHDWVNVGYKTNQSHVHSFRRLILDDGVRHLEDCFQFVVGEAQSLIRPMPARFRVVYPMFPLTNDTEIMAGPFQRPEKVWVRGVGYRDDRCVGKDDASFNHRISHEAVLSLKPAVAATQHGT